MIRLYDDNANEISCDGTTDKGRELVGSNTTLSTNGARDKTYVRKTNTYSLNINKLTSQDYEILLDMLGNTLYIEDRSKNIIDGNLFFSNDSIQLNPIEDKVNNTYFYTGNLELTKS